jgi:hypothetical protein
LRSDLIKISSCNGPSRLAVETGESA